LGPTAGPGKKDLIEKNQANHGDAYQCSGHASLNLKKGRLKGYLPEPEEGGERGGERGQKSNSRIKKI